jgi:hypothetical protein
MVMAKLDDDALDFMNNKGSDSSLAAHSDIQFGGKRRTAISSTSRQHRQASYISDDPERLIQYIEHRKDEFVTEEQAMDVIRETFMSDNSLRHLLKGLQDRGVESRELKSLLKTDQVQGWFTYKNIARRLGMTPTSFKKYLNNIDPRRFAVAQQRLRRDRRQSVTAAEIFIAERQGRVKGQLVTGRLSQVKINSRIVIRYRDAKGRFIKT